jgi:nucleoside 2-deoxyribosyltransferase
MKITLCGSIAFFDDMDKIKKQLESLGHEVKLPPYEIKDDTGKMISVKEYYKKRKSETKDTSWIWERKKEAMKNHFNKVEWCDAILVLNYTKNNILNYIGANTLMEMGLALHLNKPIYLLNSIPEISYQEEILGMKPIIIDNNLELIK